MPTGGDVAGVTYSYRPSVLGATWAFTLAGDALLWDTGRKSGRIPYRTIRRVRMSFRPMSIQTVRFRTEVWSEGAPTIDLVSTSWKSMVEQERLDSQYRAFIIELHKRIALAAGAVRFDQGVAVPVYWLAVAIFTVASLAMAAMIARGLQASAWAGVAFVAAFLAFFLWWGGNYFRHNRPGHYSADALPTDLMPKGETPGA